MSFEKIIEEIKELENKGTEPDPSYYSDLFLSIMDFGGIPKDNQERYLKYVFDFMNNKLKKSKNGN